MPKKVNIFALGPSAVVYFAAFFYLVPLLSLLGAEFPFMRDDYKIPWRALGVITLGLVGLIAGYWSGIGRRLATRVPSAVKGTWNVRRTEVVFWVVFLVGIFVKGVRAFGGPLGETWYSATGFLEWFGYTAIALAFTVHYSLRAEVNSHRRWQFYAWAALILELFYAFPTCSRMKVIVPILVFLIVRSYLVKFQWWYVLGAALVMLLLFPFGSICRNPHALQSHGVVVDGTVGAGEAGSFVSESVISRLNQAYLVEKVIEADIPLQYGKPFLDFFVGLGPPRAIWKSKPAISAGGNEFGHRIGVLNPEDTTTSVGPTHVGDWYVNFGTLGVIVGMALMGVFWRFVYEYLVGGNGVPASGVFVYSILWLQIVLGMENTIAPVYAGFVKLAVVLFLISFFVKKPRRLRGVPHAAREATSLTESSRPSPR